MCIIVCKPAGIEMPSNDIFANCFSVNNDGAGVSYTKNGKVVIDKGYMTLKNFNSAIAKIKKIINTKDEAMTFHFRIGTQGNNNRQNCHPFPISDQTSDIISTKNITDVSVSHNGIIDMCSATSSKNDDMLSDTMLFVRDYLSIILSDKRKVKNKKTLLLIERLIKSKMAFLNSDKTITTIGDFLEENGVLYSNHSYIARSYYDYMYPDGIAYRDEIFDGTWLNVVNDTCFTYNKNSSECEAHAAGTLAFDVHGNIFEYDLNNDCCVWADWGEVLDYDYLPIEFNYKMAEKIPVIY